MYIIIYIIVIFRRFKRILTNHFSLDKPHNIYYICTSFHLFSLNATEKHFKPAYAQLILAIEASIV